MATCSIPIAAPLNRGRQRFTPPAASRDAAGHRAVTPLQRLPAVTYSYNLRQVDCVELANLLRQVACFAPGQSFHTASASGGSVDPQRLRGALRRSLVSVAAYASEQHLPHWQHLSSRGLRQQQDQQEQQQQQQGVPWPTQPGWQRQQRPVLVGFARAVGDASLVATVHDVAVMREMRHLGLGRQLLGRLLRQLDVIGIIDVGLLAPESSQGFFAACRFGDDTEHSTTMTLSETGLAERQGLPLCGMKVHLKGSSWHVEAGSQL